MRFGTSPKSAQCRLTSRTLPADAETDYKRQTVQSRRRLRSSNCAKRMLRHCRRTLESAR
eukprot:8009884-Alexandrium_andersonii.AAC.1